MYQIFTGSNCQISAVMHGFQPLSVQMIESLPLSVVLDKIVIFNYLRITIIRRVQLANTDTDTDSYEYQ